MTTTPQFPPEIWQSIFQFADVKTIGRLALVSRQFRALTNEERLWSVLCLRDMPKLRRDLALSDDSFRSLDEFDGSSEETWRKAQEFGVSRQGWKDTYRLYIEARKGDAEVVKKPTKNKCILKTKTIATLIAWNLFLVAVLVSVILTTVALNGGGAKHNHLPFTFACIPALAGLVLFTLAIMFSVTLLAIFLVLLGVPWLLFALYGDGWLIGDYFICCIPFVIFLTLPVIACVFLIFRSRNCKDFLTWGIRALVFVLDILWLILVSVRFNGALHCSFVLCYLPYYLSLVLLLFIPPLHCLQVFIRAISILPFQFLQFLLIPLRLDGTIKSNWFAVLIPLYLVILILFVAGLVVGIVLASEVIGMANKLTKSPKIAKLRNKANMATLKSMFARARPARREEPLQELQTPLLA
eukprot:gnl/Trimastix_PCT/2761.p1 GENE.gnl/Trimastix_PCT/2761~~gnl/Trimastix_PCT/2761.p1  ORF type:complete len:411 (+),score=99.88 gnl/Trimastix_PCT/2761:100-1332(+)